MQDDEFKPTKQRSDSDRGDELRAKAAKERRERDKRHAYRERSLGKKLNALSRRDLLDLAKRFGAEYARHLNAKIKGKRTWRSLVTINDRRVLLTQFEKEFHEQTTANG